MKNKDYFTEREIKIIEYLTESEGYTTSENLAEELHVSTRTIKTDIKRLNIKTLRFGFQINAKHRYGYRLTVTDNHLYESFRNTLLFETDNHWIYSIPQNRTQRINYIILKLLSVDYYIQLDDLAEEMGVEKSTLQSYMNDVRLILAKYHLQIESVYKRGVILIGSEIDIRICSAEYFFHNSITKNILTEDNSIFDNESSQKEIKQIKAILSQVLKKHKIHISNVSFESMTIHIYVATRRWIFYNYVKCDENYLMYIKDSKELNAGIELKSILENKYNIMLPFDEAVYFAIHFKTKHIENDFDMHDNLEIHEVILDIFEQIQIKFGIDFTVDEQLIHLLSMHLPAMISRLELNMTLRNIQSYEYFRKYILAFLMTKEVYKVIDKRYSLKIDVNEYSFLVLYFNLAIERELKKKKVKLLLITGSGRPEGIVLFNMIKEKFGQRIEQMDIANYTNHEQIDQYDLIVTTFPISINAKPVILFGSNEQKNFEDLEQAINSLYVHNFDIRKSFPIRNLFTKLSASTKYDVFNLIQMKCNASIKKSEISYVLEMDNYLPSEIGNLTAILPIENKKKTSEIFCFVLKKPIIWDKQYVQIIFVVSNNTNNIWESSLLCKAIQDFIKNIHFHEIDNKNKLYEEFIKII